MDRRDFLKTASFASVSVVGTWTGVSLPDVDTGYSTRTVTAFCRCGVSLPDVDTGYSTILDLHAPAEVERLYHIECKNRKL